MLERAALHQTRFRTPGVAPDSRGVVLGHKGVVLFPSIDRLVSFLRGYGEDSSLDEIVPSMQIRTVITPLRTREVLLVVQAESSYRMDRIAGVAKLAGGLVFTGTSRHFVKYRDAGSPLGYDVQELVDQPADLVLYHDSFRQPYAFEREIAFRDLIMKLTPQRLPPGEARGATPSKLYVTAEVGVGDSLVRYLFRWRVSASVAVAEWPSQSAFDDAPRRIYVFEMDDVPPRIVRLLCSLPGVTVFDPLIRAVGVELGYKHPIALESCAAMFEGDAVHLFRGDGHPIVITPVPPFAPVASLVRTELHLERPDDPRARPMQQALDTTLPLQLAVSNAPWRNVVATVVPGAQRDWLARLLYVLPPGILSALRIALAPDRAYILDAKGIEGVPLGTFYTEVAPRIYVPAGLTLVPAVAPEVLAALIPDRADGHVFFEPGERAPRVVPDAAFAPLSARHLRAVAPEHVSARAPEAQDVPLPLLQYGESRMFPLWGVPGADVKTDEEAK